MGFEPTKPDGFLAFKASPINHSGNFPYIINGKGGTNRTLSRRVGICWFTTNRHPLAEQVRVELTPRLHSRAKSFPMTPLNHLGTVPYIINNIKRRPLRNCSGLVSVYYNYTIHVHKTNYITEHYSMTK